MESGRSNVAIPLRSVFSQSCGSRTVAALALLQLCPSGDSLTLPSTEITSKLLAAVADDSQSNNASTTKLTHWRRITTYFFPVKIAHEPFALLAFLPAPKSAFSKRSVACLQLLSERKRPHDWSIFFLNEEFLASFPRHLLTHAF